MLYYVLCVLWLFNGSALAEQKNQEPTDLSENMLTPLPTKEKITVSVSKESHLSIDQDKKHALNFKNNFVGVTLGVNIADYRQVVLYDYTLHSHDILLFISAQLGYMFNNKFFGIKIPSYYFEGRSEINLQFGKRIKLITVGLALEYNFIKNDSKHRFIPGLKLATGFGYGLPADLEAGIVHFDLYGGFFYKLFTSKSGALIPNLRAGYRFFHQNGFYMSGHISLRRYF